MTLRQKTNLEALQKVVATIQPLKEHYQGVRLLEIAVEQCLHADEDFMLNAALISANLICQKVVDELDRVANSGPS